MYLNNDPFAQLPNFGGGSMYPGGPMTMAGGSGFAGDMPSFGEDPMDPKKKKKGMFGAAWPMFGLTGMLAHGGNLGSIAPLIGGAMGFGLSRLLK